MLIFDQLKKSDKQLQLLAVGILFGLVLLLARLWHVQVISAKRFQADVQGQSIRTVRVPAIRGKILDRNGAPLADNRPCYSVNLYLEELRTSFNFHYTNEVRPRFLREHPKTTITKSLRDELGRQTRYQVVSNFLLQVSSCVEEPRLLLESEFHKFYDSQRTLPLQLLRDLSFEQVAKFVEKSPSLSSLALETQPFRVYRYKTNAAHLIGHLRKNDNPSDEEDFTFKFRLPDYRGVKGIEWAFDRELRGKPGVKSVLVNSMQYRQSEEMSIPPEPGRNVVLTIDLAIQQAADKGLFAASRTAEKETRGAVVVMDCQNGDILAMSSAPAFDPNEFMAPISDERGLALNDEKLLPMFNRAAYGLYQPGSTFKIVSGLACLEAGLDPDESIYSPNYFQLRPRGHVWKDTAGEWNYDFRTAFCYSSNFYFQTNGVNKAGAKRIVEVGQRFGLGELTGITKGLESKGYFPDHEKLQKRDGSRWMDGDTANLCIGQGELKVTPLQMAVMTGAIANGGKLLEPRLVMRIETQDSEKTIEEFPAGRIRREVKIQPQHLSVLRRAMRDDVERYEPSRLKVGLKPWGTGHVADVKGMNICGKTGTAQVFDEHNYFKEYTTWFVSYAPFENPRYVVVVVVEGGSSGGGSCAPVARIVYEALLKREQQSKGSSMAAAPGVPAHPLRTASVNLN